MVTADQIRALERYRLNASLVRRAFHIINPVGAPIIEGIYLESRVDNHNQIVSADVAKNWTVLSGTRQLIAETGTTK